MQYQVTITRIEEKKSVKKGEWTTIDRRPWTTKELSEESKYSSTVEAFLEKNPTKAVLGYAPDQETVEKVQVQVLAQTVEDIDIGAVIKAINKL